MLKNQKFGVLGLFSTESNLLWAFLNAYAWAFFGSDHLATLPLAPPTKSGKNNDCRQTNARTVVINKYINFFDGSV